MARSVPQENRQQFEEKSERTSVLSNKNRGLSFSEKYDCVLSLLASARSATTRHAAKRCGDLGQNFRWCAWRELNPLSSLSPTFANIRPNRVNIGENAHFTRLGGNAENAFLRTMTKHFCAEL